jgi:DNA-binding transcriptional LysR family regulator
VSALAEDFGSLRRVAEALGVDAAQVSRWARGGGIDPKNAARLDLLELTVSAISRLYEPAVMEDWLFGLNPSLGERRPIDVIRSGDLTAVLRAIRAEEGESFA